MTVLVLLYFHFMLLLITLHLLHFRGISTTDVFDTYRALINEHNTNKQQVVSKTFGL